jgi:hypothetical protein
LKTICIRQPGYIPNIGFFKKIQSVDEFVYLDDVKYKRGAWDNRNYIKATGGKLLLSVPIHNNRDEKLNEAKIVNSINWQKKHKVSIENNYSKAPYFKQYWLQIEKILQKNWDRLIELNFALIDFFNLSLDIKTKTIKSSELKIHNTGSQRLLNICKKLNAEIYLSGELGKNYLDNDLFKNEGIKVVYEKFEPPKYNQIYGDFIPNLSVIDLLFNEGPNAAKILKETKNF